MHAYTGGKLNLRNYAYPVVVDLSGMVIGRKSKPVLRDHSFRQIIGHSTDIVVNSKGLYVQGVISGANGHSSEVVASAKLGFPWEASIGARPEKMAYVDAGETVQVNGRSFTGPLYVARKSRLGEISFVAIGADEGGATARVAAISKETEMGFEAWCEAAGIDITAMSEEQLENLMGMYQREQERIRAAAGDTEDDTDPGEGDPNPQAGGDINATLAAFQDELRRASAAETKRISAIGKLCGNQHPEIQARAIENGWTAEKTELEILRSQKDGEIGKSINAAFGANIEAATEARVIEASLLGSLGFKESEVKAMGFADKEMELALGRNYRGAGLNTVIRACLHRAGKYARPDVIDNGVIEAAFHADLTLKAAGGGGGWSTTSLSGIMSNLANKLMLAGYGSVDTAVPEICHETDTNDFKPFTRYRLLGTGILERLGPNGEITHTELSEQTYSNQLKTYAKMLSLSREMMINDDLGAFAEIPRIFGRMSALTREEIVFTLLLSNPSNFFHADNKNLASGALAVDTLTSAVTLFRNQTAPDGRPILVSPKKLLVPPALEVTARQLYDDLKIQSGTDGKVLDGNPHARMYMPVVSPFISLATLAGYSATQWYLTADPRDIYFMQVAYLRGQRGPVLESAQADFNTLGMQWRNYYDFGVAMGDPRAAVKSPGT